MASFIHQHNKLQELELHEMHKDDIRWRYVSRILHDWTGPVKLWVVGTSDWGS
jgi:hypothetical protein